MRAEADTGAGEPNAGCAGPGTVRPRLLGVLAVLLLAWFLSGCGSTGPAPVYGDYRPAPAGYYRIRSGDTLLEIARRHKIGYERLARWNDLGPPYRIYAGSLLRVVPPEGKTAQAERVAAKATKAPVTTTKVARSAAKPSGSTSGPLSAPGGGAEGPGGAGKGSALRWRWPLAGKVVRGFRAGDRTRQGIRISGQPGQKVLAAEGGSVVYSGSGLKGYGNLIILKHNNDFLSAYGFNRRLFVNEGARVERGQVVAEVGQASGKEYLLHFEIRRKGSAVDPLTYLP